MIHSLVRYLVPLVLSVAYFGISEVVMADELLVFVSAFAKGDQGAIQAYLLNDQTGELKPTQRTGDMEHPFFTALSPNRKYLYAIHAPGEFGGKDYEQVAAYEITGPKGELKLLNRQSSRGTASCYLDVDATGKTVLVANYSTGSVAALPVREDGSLGEATAFIQHVGSSVDPARQTGPHAHCIVISPDNKFVYAADLGLDQVLGYRLDAATSKLTPNKQPFARTIPGAGPRHLTFHPNGKHVYVINELKNSVTLFDYDGASGVLLEQQTLPTLPPNFKETSHTADVKITPNGQFLYGTNRGHDSIAAYRLDEAGRMKLLGIEPSLGKGPQNLAITPNGAFILCANMPGNNVAVFKINPETGALKSVGEPISITSPSCIRIR